MKGYEIIQTEFTENHLGQYASLLGQVFPGAQKFTTRFLKWQYVENPDGKAVGFDAWHGENLAAHYVTLPIRANVFGELQKGLLSINTATSPAHQGRKLFTTLADKTYDLAASQGFEFVVGVANANSTPGFVKKLGFWEVAPLNVMLGLGDLSESTLQHEYEFNKHWDNETLDWRLANPSAKYYKKETKEGGIIYANSGKYGIYANLGQIPVGIKYLETLGALHNPLKMWIGLDRYISGNKGLYKSLPHSLRPSPLNLIFRSLTNSSQKLNAEEVKFRLLDFDAY